MGLSEMLLNTSAMGRPSSSCSVSKACRQGACMDCTLQEDCLHAAERQRLAGKRAWPGSKSCTVMATCPHL